MLAKVDAQMDEVNGGDVQFNAEQQIPAQHIMGAPSLKDKQENLTTKYSDKIVGTGNQGWNFVMVENMESTTLQENLKDKTMRKRAEKRTKETRSESKRGSDMRANEREISEQINEEKRTVGTKLEEQIEGNNLFRTGPGINSDYNSNGEIDPGDMELLEGDPDVHNTNSMDEEYEKIKYLSSAQSETSMVPETPLEC